MKTYPIGAALFLLALSALSCTEEELRSSTQNHISFYLSESGRTKSTDSLSQAVTSARLNTPMVSDQGDTLYLHCSSVETEFQISDRLLSETTYSGHTKARPLDMEGLETLGQFPVWAWRHGGSQAYIDGEWIFRQSAGWNFADKHYWPTDGSQLDFYALAPVLKTDGSDLLATDPLISAEGMSFSYELPLSPENNRNHDAEYQPDLVAALHRNLHLDSDEGKVSLKFKHLLSSVCFDLSDVPAGCVESVTLKNIAVSGHCRVIPSERSPDDCEVVWSVGAPSGNRTQRMDVHVLESQGDMVQSLHKDNLSTTFQLIPQKIRTDSPVRLEIVFRWEGQTESSTYSVDLSGEWKPGYTYRYQISTGLLRWHYHIEPLNDRSCNSINGSFTSSVCAYKETDGGLTDTAHWTLHFSDDDGVTWYSSLSPSLDWLTVSDCSGASGKTAPSELHIAYEEAEEMVTVTELATTHRNNLRSLGGRGSESHPCDLSLYDSYGNLNPLGRTTANCYVVSAPGWYAVPLIYGNAVADNQDRESAYVAQVSGEYVVPVLYNAYGSGIVSPYLDNDVRACRHSLDENGAELLWMDKPDLLKVSPGLIQDESGVRYLVFQVDPESIDQGNAVVAVRDTEGQIVWSWHIWVVDPSLFYTFEIESVYQKYQLLALNLGWEEYQYVHYDYQERHCRFKVCAGDAECQFELCQESGEDETYLGAFPLYQWGRKDPLIPAVCLGEFEYLPLYGNSPSRYSDGDTPVTAAEAIRHPEIFYRIKTGPANWCSDNGAFFYNMWDNSNNVGVETERDPVKTVYDPCPPGFRLPTSSTFNLMLTSFVVGRNRHGQHYYRTRWKNSTFLMPCPGVVYNYTNVSISENHGSYWSYFPYSQSGIISNNYGRSKDFHIIGVARGSGFRSNGFLIRPVTMKN